MLCTIVELERSGLHDVVLSGTRSGEACENAIRALWLWNHVVNETPSAVPADLASIPGVEVAQLLDRLNHRMPHLHRLAAAEAGDEWLVHCGDPEQPVKMRWS